MWYAHFRQWQLKDSSLMKANPVSLSMVKLGLAIIYPWQKTSTCCPNLVFYSSWDPHGVWIIFWMSFIMWKNRLLSKIAVTLGCLLSLSFELSHQCWHGRIASKAATLTGVGGDRRRMETCVVELCSHQQTVYSSQMKGCVFLSEGVDSPKERETILKYYINRGPARQSTM